jgi:comEA protein
MRSEKNKNIEKSTYKGLLFFTVILMSIFVFRTLLFSYEIHSYNETDKKFANNELFAENGTENKDVVENSNSNKDTLKMQNTKQKNIIKDLTLNQKIVNINKSLKDELIKLPGIGPKTAEKIIIYRTENGDFQSKNDLKKVKGIGSAKLKKIKKLIKLK